MQLRREQELDAGIRLRRQARVGWTLVMVLVLTYLVVASSPEFRGYAPVSVSAGVLYLAFILAHLVAGYLCDDVQQGFSLLAVMVTVPLVLYSGSMLLLPVLAGRAIFVQLLMYAVIGRIVGYLFSTAAFGLLGLMVGVILAGLQSR